MSEVAAPLGFFITIDEVRVPFRLRRQGSARVFRAKLAQGIADWPHSDGNSYQEVIDHQWHVYFQRYEAGKYVLCFF